MDPVMAGSLGVMFLLVLLGLRVPIGVALASVGFLGTVVILGAPQGRSVNWSRGMTAAWDLLERKPYSATASFALATVPLFLMMGYVAHQARFTRDAFGAAQTWLAGQRGGLAMAAVCGSAMFAAISGSSLAATAAMSRLAVPQMLRLKYEPGLATGVVAASGTLGSLIPPSVLLILYGIFTEQSIGRLLLAGIIPGVVSVLIYIGMIWLRVRANPSLAPDVERTSWGEKFTSLKGIWSIMVLFVIVMGGIYTGFVTPTEAAAIGAFGTWVLAFMARRLDRARVRSALLETAIQVSSIFLIVVGAKIFVAFIALSGLSASLAGYVAALDVSPVVFMVLLTLVYVVLGMFLDPLGIMLLTLPVITPAVSALGYDLIWFGIIMIKYLEIGLITPPVGLNLFVLQTALNGRVGLGTVSRGALWFVVADLVTVALLVAFPGLVTWLPNILWG